MQLNKEQIDLLFDFVRSKYVRYIDIQYELVDHLASDIEHEMKSNQSLSFEQALKKVYSKFPLSGFSNYVRQSEQQLSRFWRRKILSEISYGYGLPMIFGLAFFTLSFYNAIIYGGQLLFITLLIITLTFIFISTRKLNRVIRSFTIDKIDNYLVLSIFNGSALAISVLPIYVGQIFFDFNTLFVTQNQIYTKVLSFSILLSLTNLWSLMVYLRFPRLISSTIKEKYLHLNLSM